MNQRYFVSVIVLSLGVVCQEVDGPEDPDGRRGAGLRLNHHRGPLRHRRPGCRPQEDRGEAATQEAAAIPVAATLTPPLALQFCPQEGGLWEHLTPRQHLRLYGNILGFSAAADVETQVTNMLNHLDLAPHADKTVKELSGGNKRKTSVGIALLGDSRACFLDEPSAGVKQSPTPAAVGPFQTSCPFQQLSTTFQQPNRLADSQSGAGVRPGRPGDAPCDVADDQGPDGWAGVAAHHPQVCHDSQLQSLLRSLLQL